MFDGQNLELGPRKFSYVPTLSKPLSVFESTLDMAFIHADPLLIEVEVTDPKTK